MTSRLIIVNFFFFLRFHGAIGMPGTEINETSLSAIEALPGKTFPYAKLLLQGLAIIRKFTSVREISAKLILSFKRDALGPWFAHPF
jgi:hypothetical protein